MLFIDRLHTESLFYFPPACSSPRSLANSHPFTMGLQGASEASTSSFVGFPLVFPRGLQRQPLSGAGKCPPISSVLSLLSSGELSWQKWGSERERVQLGAMGHQQRGLRKPDGFDPQKPESSSIRTTSLFECMAAHSCRQASFPPRGDISESDSVSRVDAPFLSG